MKRIVSIQDISCLGKCSLTVALPILSAMGVECSIVPTAVLSTHTMFQNFTAKDLTDQIGPIAAHWKSENIHFDAIYTGYLASKEQIGDICAFFDTFKAKDNLIVVDPVMADNGKLYPAFGPEFPAEMAKVCARADLIVPNLTEASLLTGLPYRTEYDESYIREMLQALAKLGPGMWPSPASALKRDGWALCTTTRWRTPTAAISPSTCPPASTVPATCSPPPAWAA